MANKEVIEATISDFVENFFYLQGKPFSLDDYPHMRKIYNSDAQNIVMKFSRQTAKSTSLANLMMARAAMLPEKNQLYVSPAVAQTQEFSRDKLEPVILNSPFLREYMVDPRLVQNVLKKKFSNGSVINLRYALLNADRIRGISSDFCYFDETQDLLKDVISVIQETMSRSLIKKNVYAGTPKRTRGTLADLWYKSTQYEYAVKCDSCNHWNVLGPDNIGLTGLICSKCGSHMDLRAVKGQWVSTYDNPNNMPDMEGYRVCLLHFAHSPWVNWDKDVIYKMENTSTALFYNETLGLEYDSGAIPITKGELIAACDADRTMTPVPHKGHKNRPSIMGIDYGPVNSENSFTVISIVQVIAGKLQVVYSKRYTGKESDYAFIHEEIPRLFKEWNCSILAADYGMGEAPNSEFRNRLGPEKVLAFQHLPTQKEPIKYNTKMRAYTMNKNYIMNKFFEMLKKGKLRLPRWEDISPLAQDIRNVIIEYDETKNTQKYTNTGPDDFAHSTLFATVAAIMLFDLGEILQ